MFPREALQGMYWKGREIGLCDTHILFPGLDYVNSKGEGLGDLSCRCSPSALSKVHCDLIGSSNNYGLWVHPKPACLIAAT